MKNRFLKLIALSLVCFMLTGCGDDPELSKFKNEIDSFCDEITQIDKSINSIDASSEEAKDELLRYLNQADDSFRKLANLSLPEEFSYLDELMDSASEDMTQAVSLFEDSFSNNSFNEYTFDYAAEYYKRAYTRLTYILSLLHGEIPDNDDIIIYETEEN